MEVGELRGSGKRLGGQGSEIIVRQIQINQSLHSPEGTAINLMDLTELQVKGHDLVSAMETVAREVMEMVATEIEELGFRREATGDFGMTTTLACRVLGFNLRRGSQRGRNIELK